MEIRRVTISGQRPIYKGEDDRLIKIIFLVDNESRKISKYSGRGISYEISKNEQISREDEYLTMILQKSLLEEDVINIVVDTIETGYLKEGIGYVYDQLRALRNLFEYKNLRLMTESAIMGLIGELLYIKEQVEQENYEIVESWEGPNKEHHDFIYENYDVEIKATKQVGDAQIEISNEYQLEITNTTGLLYLVVYRFAKADKEQINIPNLLNQLFELIDDPSVKDELKNKVESYGYSLLLEKAYEKFSYNITDTARYQVKEDFPRIKAQNLPNGVGAVKYAVTLSACKDFKVKNIGDVCD